MIASVVPFPRFTKKWELCEQQCINSWGLDQHAISTMKLLPNYRLTGEPMTSPLNENVIFLQNPLYVKVVGRFVSFFLSCMFVLMVFVLNAVELYVCWRFETTEDSFYQKLLFTGMGVFQGVQIRLVDKIWCSVEERITDWEYWDLEDEYSLSKGVKTSIIRFTNMFNCTFFFAFIYPLNAVKCASGMSEDVCSEHVRSNLSVKFTGLFVTRFIVFEVSKIKTTMMFYNCEFKTRDLQH